MPEHTTITIQTLLEFWYTPPMNKHWFRATDAIDNEVRERFESTWQQAANGALDHWQHTAEGCLALCILLDQLPLNMFRGDARSFSTEQQAVTVCKKALEQGFDQQLDKDKVVFLYMPLMHSEQMADQDEAVRLFTASGLQNHLRFAKHHREIVRQFGRFPHRNAILGRDSTADELTYLASDQAFTG